MKDCNAIHVHLDPSLRLSKAEKERSVDEKEYRRNIRCLRYLLHTRPDLSYSIIVLRTYLQSPKQSHKAALKAVLRYLQGIISFGLSFSRSGETKVEGYNDSTHNVDDDDGKSTAGYIFYCANCPISWSSHKQETVALSSCEAEFMAGTEAEKQAIWLQELLGEIK